MSNITPEKLKQQVASYSEKKPEYKIYADTLKAVFERACRRYFPCSFVQAREKAVASFAEKVVRKAGKYKDAVNELTDLCGARVIVQTLDQVEAVRTFIRANFEVCEEDDKGAALGEDVFGYGDVHFIVRIRNFGALGISDEATKTAIGNKRAEIQVRTWLQHAIADTLHDRIYKTHLKFPREIIRLAKMLDAIRENSDKTMNALCADIDSRLANYSSFASKKQIEEEIERLKLIEVELVQGKICGEWKTALQCARLQSAIGYYTDAVSTLEKHTGLEYPEILIELGNAFLLNGDFEKAKTWLNKAVSLLREPEKNVPYDKEEYKGRKGRAHFLLACALAKLRDREDAILEAYQQALECEPGNPYYLAEAIGHKIGHGEADVSPLARNAVKTALETSHGHIKDGTELPYSCFVAGRLQALLGEPLKALADYALGVAVIRSGTVGVPPAILKGEIAWLETVEGRSNVKHDIKESCNWCARFLLLAQRAQTLTGTQDATAHVRVKIIAGGAGSFEESKTGDLRPLLESIMGDFDGKVISGGTRCGVPGVVGEVAANIGFPKERLHGYIPRNLPADATRDVRYTLHDAGNVGFTPEQILQCWEDLFASESFAPSTVKLFGFGGGPLSALEYRFALAFGVKVWVFDGFDGTAAELEKDGRWAEIEGLFIVPDDPTSR
ncbi:MAG: hypothetical protein LBV54_01895, partial [Puniceicoccales bacterium]|nr:hypothetical protein [Puniceicoccales bacterium]